MINKCFTYKGFNRKREAWTYARKAFEAGASYVEIMRGSKRFSHMKEKYIVQHNAEVWIR